MKITYYTSAEYTTTKTEETGANVILSMLDPEEMTDEDREAIRAGYFTAMCNFPTKDGHWKAIPWNRVIEIDE